MNKVKVQKKEKKPKEYSKTLLKQESVLIWIMSLSFILLAFYCIYKGFTGSLPWLAAMVGFPWSAYGVSQMMYYKKAMAENTCGGIKYESILQEVQKVKDYYEDNSTSSTTSYLFDEDYGTYSTYADTTSYSSSEDVDDYQI